MFGYYLKLSSKVVFWHLIGQLACMCVGFVVFGLLMMNYRLIDILVSVFMSCGYVVFMYSKLYKIGERDTKSYVQEQPYACKGMVLYILLFAVSVLFAYLYRISFSATSLLSKFLNYFPFRIWGYTYVAFMKAADGSISIWYWILYFAVPFVTCAVGYYAGMHRWEVGYQFFKNLVFREKK